MKGLFKNGLIMGAGGFFLILTVLSAAAASMSEEEIGVKVRAISKTLRCAVCQSESVWESGAPLAAQMRDLVRERVIAGESDDAIRAYFVSRYGDFILLKPKISGLNRVIWLGPFLLLFGFGLFLYWKIRGWARRASPDCSEPLDPEARLRVDAVLRAYAEKEE